jgi:hypothetical protein
MIGDYSEQVTYREPWLLIQQREEKFHDVSRQAGPASQRDYPGPLIHVATSQRKVYGP